MDWVGIQTGSKDFDKLWPIHVSQVVALFKSIDEGGGGAFSWHPLDSSYTRG